MLLRREIFNRFFQELKNIFPLLLEENQCSFNVKIFELATKLFFILEPSNPDAANSNQTFFQVEANEDLCYVVQEAFGAWYYFLYMLNIVAKKLIQCNIIKLACILSKIFGTQIFVLNLSISTRQVQVLMLLLKFEKFSQLLKKVPPMHMR